MDRLRLVGRFMSANKNTCSFVILLSIAGLLLTRILLGTFFPRTEIKNSIAVEKYPCSFDSIDISTPSCYKELNFSTDRYDYVLCQGVDEINITIFKRNESKEAVIYKSENLKILYDELSSCLSDRKECASKAAFVDHNNMLCKYFVNVPKLLTLCFTFEYDLYGAFVNSTVFSRSDILCLYHICQIWLKN